VGCQLCNPHLVETRDSKYLELDMGSRHLGLGIGLDMASRHLGLYMGVVKELFIFEQNLNSNFATAHAMWVLFGREGSLL
jgi:hypothetical protein